MGMRQVLTIDAQTGEPLPSTPILVGRRAHNGFTEGWTATAMNAHAALAMSDLTGRDLKVFHMLCSHMAFGNEIPINASEMSKKIGMQVSHFHRSLRALIDFGIIQVETRDGVRYYKAAPSMMWRGSGKSHRDALKFVPPSET